MSLKHWTRLCALSLAGVSAWLLPRVDQIRERPQVDQVAMGPATAKLTDLRRQAASIDGYRRRLLRLREFEAAARRKDGSLRSFTLSLSADADSGSEAVLHDRMHSALKGRVADPRVPVGLFVVDHNRHALTDLGGWVSRERYVRDGSEPYCFSVVERRGRPAMNTWLEAQLASAYGAGPNALLSTLGPCLFYAQYGLPGSRVSEWLERGGHHYASLVENERLDLQAGSFRRLFGLMVASSPLRLTLQRCAGGDQRTCAMIFREVAEPRSDWEPTAPEALPIVTFPDRRRTRLYLDASLLSYLADEFGDERFEAFWTSDLPLERAFESAFEITTGEWLHGFVLERWGGVARGAGVTRADVGGSLLFVLALVGLAIGLGRRRARVLWAHAEA